MVACVFIKHVSDILTISVIVFSFLSSVLHYDTNLTRLTKEKQIEIWLSFLSERQPKVITTSHVQIRRYITNNMYHLKYNIYYYNDYSQSCLTNELQFKGIFVAINRCAGFFLGVL